MAQISMSICLLIGRAKAGHRIQLLDANYLEPTRYYPRLWELISQLEAVCDLVFSASELVYLVTILLGSGFSQEAGQIQEGLKNQIRALIQDVSLIINLDLLDDHKLLRESRPVRTGTYRVKRFLQLYVLDSRLRGNDDSGISISNPLYFISTLPSSSVVEAAVA